jgi:hypothetical protein
MRAEVGGEVSGSQIEQLVDELILLANIVIADPPRLPLPDHVDGLVSRNRSPRCSELAKALLGLHSGKAFVEPALFDLASNISGPKTPKFPVNSLFNRELERGEWFAADCIIRY